MKNKMLNERATIIEISSWPESNQISRLLAKQVRLDRGNHANLDRFLSTLQGIDGVLKLLQKQLVSSFEINVPHEPRDSLLLHKFCAELFDTTRVNE
jgi:hypothetical protein